MEKKIKRILVPINGTKNSNHGLEMAISIAKHHDASITCVYAINTPSRSEFGGTRSVDKTLKDYADKMMEEANTLVTQNDIAFTGKILHGDAGFNIIKLAHDKKLKFNIIVIGSRNLGPIKKMFLGSVSNYVVQASKIPVLVVK